MPVPIGSFGGEGELELEARAPPRFSCPPTTSLLVRESFGNAVKPTTALGLCYDLDL